MEWVEIKIADILAHMPTDVKSRYETWLVSNPDRAGRLLQIMNNTLREFRDNLKSVPENIVDPRETWVPQSAVRHLETIVYFTLAMEMGLPIDSAALGARYAADIFLRQILLGRYKVTDEFGGAPSPHYSIPDRNAFADRALPILLALLLFVQQASGGWIRPDSGPLDTEVATTFTPTAYSITTVSLFSHLQGINAALAPLATTSYVQAAIQSIQITNSVDATARALASSASIAANAALNSLPGYLPLSGGTHTLDANGQAFTNVGAIAVTNLAILGTATGNGRGLAGIPAGTLTAWHVMFTPAGTVGPHYFFDIHGELPPQNGDNSSLRGFAVPRDFRVVGASLTRRVEGTLGVSNASPVVLSLYNKTLGVHAPLFTDVKYGAQFPPPMATNNLDVMLWATNEYSIAMSRVTWLTSPKSVQNVVILYLEKP